MANILEYGGHGMSRNRASKAELLKRRQEVQELIIQGHPKSFIVDRLAEQYKTSKRAIQEDMRLVAKDWQDKAPEESQLMRNRYEERLEWLFCEAAGKGHIKVALEVQKEIHKLNGLYKEKNEKEETIPQFINVSKRSDLKVVGNDPEEH